MKKIKHLVFGIILAAATVLQFGLLVPVAAQTDQKTITCGPDQVAVGVAINGQNCIDKGSSLQNNVIIVWISSIIKFLTVGVGIAAVGGVVYGGFLYMTARGNSAQAEKAVKTILNALIGVGLYALTFAIINYLIPGGVLR